MSELSKLRWRCRRGMRELDEAMLAYLEYHFQRAPALEQQAFRDMIELQDPELFRLFTGREKDARFQPIIDKVAAALGS